MNWWDSVKDWWEKFADAPFRVGDCIVLDSGERGEVGQIGLRSPANRETPTVPTR